MAVLVLQKVMQTEMQILIYIGHLRNLISAKEWECELRKGIIDTLFLSHK